MCRCINPVAQLASDCSSWNFRGINDTLPSTGYQAPNSFYLTQVFNEDYAGLRSSAPEAAVGPYFQIDESRCSWSVTPRRTASRCDIQPGAVSY